MATGARLGSCVSLRACLAGAALLTAACASQETTFREQGLPEDLPRYARQLEVLKVPAAVTRLDWLSSSQRLKRLVASDVTGLKHLPTLPRSLRELDIRSTSIPGPWRLPADLESLTLGGDQVRAVTGLGSSLLELTLERVPNLSSLKGLPASLEKLSVTEAPFLTHLGTVPPRLKELRLEKTQVRTLKGLPLSLRHITLKDNGAMATELPPFLESLAVKGPSVPMEQLAFLRNLDAPSLGQLRVLPTFLQSSQGPDFDSRVREVAPALIRLKLEGATAAEVPDLPSTLEELHWPGGTKLDKLPPGLKRLYIPYPPPDLPPPDLAALPEGLVLTDLDISGTEIRVDALPRTLQSLKFSSYRFAAVSGLSPSLRSLDISESPRVTAIAVSALPLLRLDVSGTSISKMPKLPVSLEELDISNTQISRLSNLDGLGKLRSLTLHAGQLESLAGLPANVTELYFVERK
ncbi:MAG TPA: hypothetical protein VN493_28690 [Thermoanaerobaculia bacterium]|nr:hypothetical protein [Thermoanaerobaculia bacterium]